MRTLLEFTVDYPGIGEIPVKGWYTRTRSDAGPEEEFELDEYTAPDDVDAFLLDQLCIEECQKLHSEGLDQLHDGG